MCIRKPRWSSGREWTLALSNCIRLHYEGMRRKVQGGDVRAKRQRRNKESSGVIPTCSPPWRAASQEPGEHHYSLPQYWSEAEQTTHRQKLLQSGSIRSHLWAQGWRPADAHLSGWFISNETTEQQSLTKRDWWPERRSLEKQGIFFYISLSEFKNFLFLLYSRINFFLG